MIWMRKMTHVYSRAFLRHLMLFTHHFDMYKRALDMFCAVCLKTHFVGGYIA